MHTQTAHSFDNAWKTAGMDTHAPLKWEDKDSPSVVLRGFTVKQGGLLLREYLRAKVSRLPQAPSEVYPFTESALDAIAQATAERDQSPGDSTIAPRGLMDTAYHIFAAALSRQVQGPLGPDFVAHVFNGTPYWFRLVLMMRWKKPIQRSPSPLSRAHAVVTKIVLARSSTSWPFSPDRGVHAGRCDITARTAMKRSLLKLWAGDLLTRLCHRC